VSNFTFLKTDWPELYETAREAEQNVASTPGSTPLTLQLSHRLYARRSLERAVKWLYANDTYLKQPYADNTGDYRTWERIYCENISPVHILVTSRQIGSLFALEFPKINPRPAVLSRRFPNSDRLLAALIHGLRLRSAPDCCPVPESKAVPERSRRGLFPKILTIQKIGNCGHAQTI
jgi:hypothetical protein